MNGVIFIGMQASGKTSFYKARFFASHIRINLDMLKTRHREAAIFKACIAARQSLVIDNTNPRREDRRRYIASMKQNGFSIDGYYFQSVLNACMTRNSLRAGKERIPEKGLLATHAALQLPRYDEGFDRLFYVSMSQGEFVSKEWCDEV